MFVYKKINRNVVPVFKGKEDTKTEKINIQLKETKEEPAVPAGPQAAPKGPAGPQAGPAQEITITPKKRKSKKKKEKVTLSE